MGYVMRWKALTLLTVAAGLAMSLVETTGPAAAQTAVSRDSAALSTSTDVSAQRRRPPRVTVYPIYRERLLYRQCVDWYVVEARVATGPTVVPRIRCWWVRG